MYWALFAAIFIRTGLFSTTVTGILGSANEWLHTWPSSYYFRFLPCVTSSLWSAGLWLVAQLDMPFLIYPRLRRLIDNVTWFLRF
ncbi:hypothetical protein EDB84DRAFT_120515 [Lactarius hengduanensis]|nr:hypothetical protein EDB84DRAFT_120515 [Lactarius hengduanensis]